MALYPSNNSAINAPTYDEAFANRVATLNSLAEEKLSNCFKVSVEGHGTSFCASEIRAVYAWYFRSCGEIYEIVIPRDSASDVAERCGFIYFFEEGAQQKALALSGNNVGFPFKERYGVPTPRGNRLGGWIVVVKPLPKQSCAFSPDELADAHRRTRNFWASPVVVTGYDTSLPADVIKSALVRLFSPCGEILYVSVKNDRSQPGLLRSSCCVCLAGEEARAKAVELGGSDLGGWIAAVKRLEPMGDPVMPRHLANIPVGWEGPPGYRWRDIHPSTSSQ